MTQWLISLVSAWGYIAIFVTMVGESAGSILWRVSSRVDSGSLRLGTAASTPSPEAFAAVCI